MNKIITIIFALMLSSCIALTGPSQPVEIRGDFFVSTKTNSKSSCEKQHCELSFFHNEVMLYTNEHNLILNDFELNLHNYAIGKEANGTEWEIEVGNMRKYPFLLLLNTDSVTIFVGSACY